MNLNGGLTDPVLWCAVLFLAKLLSNMLSTGKTILVQRNRSLLAGLMVAVSDLIYFFLIKNVLSDDSLLAVAWSPRRAGPDAFSRCCWATGFPGKGPS